MTNPKFLPLFILFALLSLPSLTWAEGVYFEKSEFETALAKAKAEDKLLFVDAVTDWCAPCKWMAKEVFTHEDVATFFNANFINLKVDMEKGEGPALAERYDVHAYPSLIFLDGEGEEVTRVIGGRTVSALLNLGERVLSDMQPIESLTAKFESGEYDRKWLFNYIMRLTDERVDAEAAIEKFRPGMAGEQLMEDENWTIFELYFREVGTPEFEYVMSNQDAFRAAFGKETVDNKIGINYSFALMNAAGARDFARYDSLRAVVLAVDIKDVESDIYKLDIRKYKQQLSADGYAHMVVGVVESGKLTEHYFLNQFAWEFYETQEDPQMLSLAVKWAERAVEEKRSYANLDTYGMLLFKTGQREKAIAVCQEAIELAESKGKDASDTEREMAKWL